jgi:primosomal replication protein N''
MSTLQQLSQQLEQQLLTLAGQASRIDQAAPAWQRRDWFDSELFQCHSPQLLDYVQEAMHLLSRLQQPPRGHGELYRIQQANQQRLAEKLAAQIQALTRAFSCLDIRQREKGKWRTRTDKTTTTSKLTAQQQATAAQRQRAGQLLAELGGSHQALYQKLSETLEFERRLQQLIQQAAIEQHEPARQLALHARLGRCRKALSQLEAEIQWLEQKKEY